MRPRSGDVESVTQIIKPSHIDSTKDWDKRSKQLQDAIIYFLRYKPKNIVLYRFKIELWSNSEKIPYDQFQKFFGILNKKAIRPQGFKGYLDFLYFWKENFRTQDLIQDMIIIVDANTLIDVPESENEPARLRDIPAEFRQYIEDVLSENLDIFEDTEITLRFKSTPVMQDAIWDMPAELIIETRDKAKWAFFENKILPYFVFMEMFDVNYSDEIRNRFKRGQKS